MKDSKMSNSKKLHPRNRHLAPYDFEQLVISNPDLGPYIAKNKHDNLSVDFANPKAVLQLNRALILRHYDLSYWDLPEDFLCPAVPGRADYIHYVADLFPGNNENLNCLDIGIGANCIYPIIAVKDYSWNMVGSEINKKAFKVAQAIIGFNPKLKKKVDLRFQLNKEYILHDIILPKDNFDLVISNPPFYNSEQEAIAQTRMKNKKLKLGRSLETRNFGGRSHELVYEGGEIAFILNLIDEGQKFKRQVKWFTTLVSNKESLKPLQKAINKSGASDVKIIPMSQGSKSSRILAWKY